MEKMSRCPEGHYYAKSAHVDGCPHCKEMMLQNTPRNRSGGDRANDDAADLSERTIPARRPESRAPKDDTPKDDDGRTSPVWRRKTGIDPVCGWLVCWEGANQGRDFRVLSGRNTIGRDTGSDICIRGDETISRTNHASIFYDARKIAFHIVVGDGRDGVYVNDDVVLDKQQLSPYDIVEVGHTKLMFVPLCGDRFQWTQDPKDAKAPRATRVTGPDDDDDDDEARRRRHDSDGLTT
ncbi:FHA domain-containing protein [Ideonella sp. YS5]|uniref:FHA domain-containing protein n=1 Tax=Ideonella sp. YS5 TaxID=3453714 RepID=UPI003EEC5331